MWTFIIFIIILGIFASHYWAIIPFMILILGIVIDSVPAGIIGGALSFAALYGVHLWKDKER